MSAHAPSHPVSETNRINWLVPYGVCFLVTFAAALFGSQFLPGRWYASLNKPPLNPPNWIFGPAWTLLYILMATAAGHVWSQVGWRRSRAALSLFFAQLALNGLWSYLFFGLQSPLASLVDIVILWLAIVATMRSFFQHSVLSGWLLAPYLAWVTYASYLNFMIWRLN